MKYVLMVLIIATYINAYENLKSKSVINQTAYITSQCYTKTVDSKNKDLLHNPCFSCHVKNKEPNFTLFDEELQLEYAFPAPALKNPWTNLFKDRTKEVGAMSDKYIMSYIKNDNYKKNGEIILARKLQDLPQEWDYNDNGKWDGYIPDCYFDFDDEGFDRDPRGEYTGWRAFAYSPFLGTFWPTNGSTDDVLIRLAEAFMQDSEGSFNLDVYKLNLLIVESLIKQKTIEIEPVDETLYGVDLNQDGKLGIAKNIVFKWETPKYDSKTLKISDFTMSYVGKAKELLETNEYLIAPGLYPKDTEFLHTVRYIDVKSDGSIALAPRLKELRYGKKHFWYSYFQLSNAGMAGVKEKESQPDTTTRYIGDMEVGLNNKLGWYYQGFIEDESGELRPQSYEETLFCMGCHSNIGAIADSTFVYQRKLEKGSYQNGWYHWSQKGLEGIKDRKLPNGETEYVRYLKSNNAGDEFRQNQEVMEKFFVKGWQKDIENIKKDLAIKEKNPDALLAQEWKLKKEAIERLRNDISYLILPSKERAVMLNKAYKVIVDEQSFIYGRDAHVAPAKNVHKEVKDGETTHLWVIER